MIRVAVAYVTLLEWGIAKSRVKVLSSQANMHIKNKKSFTSKKCKIDFFTDYVHIILK